MTSQETEKVAKQQPLPRLVPYRTNGLGVRGSKLYLQTKGNPKPSRIPRPLHTGGRAFCADGPTEATPPLPLRSAVVHPPLSSGAAPIPPLVCTVEEREEEGEIKIGEEEEKEEKGDDEGFKELAEGSNNALLKDGNNSRSKREREEVVAVSGVPQRQTVKGREVGGQRRGGGGVRRSGGMQRKEVGRTRGTGKGSRERNIATSVSARRQGEGANLKENGEHWKPRGRVVGPKRGLPMKQGTRTTVRHRQDRSGKGTAEQKRRAYLAHKYNAVWGRRVFGRVLPSAARRHHAVQLKRKAFRAWSEQWWASRREWKLNIRAECHNRYRLWFRVWESWTRYVQWRRQRRLIQQTAARHGGLRLKRLVWRSWCEYVVIRSRKKVLKARATNWDRATAVRSAWVVWRRVLQGRKAGHLMAHTALHHRALRLQKQAWGCWVRCYRERLSGRQKKELAEGHWAGRLVGRSWQAWTLYTEHRMRKKHETGVALQHYWTTALAKHFVLWHTRLSRVRELSQFEELVAERGTQATKRRALTRWTHYVAVERHHRQEIQLAIWHHQTTLKSRAIACLRRNSVVQRVQAGRKAVGDSFHVRKLLQRAWRVWLQRCEHCEEIKMLPLTRRAREFFKIHWLGTVFPAWMAFIQYTRHQKAQKALADAHFKSTALPKCFAALQNYCALQSYKRELLEQAQTFRRETLLSMVYYKWWRAYHFSQEMRALERVAILHSEKKVRKRALKVWRVQTRARVKQLNKERLAELHYRRRLVSGALEQWRMQWWQRTEAQQHATLAQSHHTLKMMRGAWHAWMEYVLWRRQSHEECAHATRHHHRVLLVAALTGWKIYHVFAKRKSEEKWRASQLYYRSLKRHTLAQWQDNVQLIKLQWELEQEAIVHFEKRLTANYFEAWRQRTARRSEARRRESERVQEAATHLARAKQVRVLAAWREFTSSSMVRRMATERADIHFNCCLLYKCFSAWCNYRSVGLRKRLLMRRCEHFERNRLLTTFYAQWRLQFMKAVVMKQKSTLALCHWSQILQRKALLSWLLYTFSRKRKADRYAQALQRYRSRLLHIGVTQWIKYASSMKSQRMENVLQHQTQTVQRTMQCVRRCVCHWKAAVKKRSVEEPHARRGPYSIPEQRLGKALQQTTSDMIWSHITKAFQIPDTPITKRPQPRLPDYLRTAGSHGRSSWLTGDGNTVTTGRGPLPRCVVPQPPSPPLLYSHPLQNRKESEGESTVQSFTFLPSTCSSEHSFEQSHTLERQTYGPNSRLPLNVSRTQQPLLGQWPAPISMSKQLPVLLPPSIFEKPREEAEGIVKSSLRVVTHHTSKPTKASLKASGKKKQANASLEASGTGRQPLQTTISSSQRRKSPIVAAESQEQMKVDLHSPAMRSQIVHMRDELRNYHELRAKQKRLEDQIAQARANGDHIHPPSTELLAELGRTVQMLRSNEPAITNMASCVHDIVSRKS